MYIKTHKKQVTVLAIYKFKYSKTWEHRSG